LVNTVAVSFGICSQNANYFMGHEALLRCLREPAGSPCPKPDEFSSYTSTLFFLRFLLIWYYPVRYACAFQAISVVARLHPQSPNHFTWQTSLRVSQTGRSCYLSHVIATAT